MTTHTSSRQLYASVHAAEFPAQALLRLRPDLKSKPIVVLEGTAPKEFVCAMNRHARRRGATLGLTRMESEEMEACACFRDRQRAKLQRDRYFLSACRSSLRESKMQVMEQPAFLFSILQEQRDYLVHHNNWLSEFEILSSRRDFILQSGLARTLMQRE